VKTKRFDKKLVLNKKTIAHLGYVEMKAVEGKGQYPCVTIGADTCISFLGWTCTGCPTYCETCPQTGVPVCPECAIEP
jgi:hypothetical protein